MSNAIAKWAFAFNAPVADEDGEERGDELGDGDEGPVHGARGALPGKKRHKTGLITVIFLR